MFNIKDWSRLELQSPETMKSFGITQKINRQNKNWRKCESLEVVEVVLVQCNLVEHQYQWKSEVLYFFMSNKSFAYLLNVERSNLIFLKTH